jgi:hypothetical protein
MAKYRTMGIPRLIRTMSNKDLLAHLKKHYDEVAYPERHTRFVMERQFWGAKGMALLKAEVVRRKKLGLLKRTALARHATRQSTRYMPTGFAYSATPRKKEKVTLW